MFYFNVFIKLIKLSKESKFNFHTIIKLFISQTTSINIYLKLGNAQDKSIIIRHKLNIEFVKLFKEV